MTLPPFPCRTLPKPASMEACEHCDLCMDACPTGAIGGRRFLLSAEACLVHHNELPGPWPPGLNPSVHHCLIGCMACQECCPVNVDRLRTEPAGIAFDREETSAILEISEEKEGPIWHRIREKLTRIDMVKYDQVIGRNLQALLRSGRSSVKARGAPSS